MFTGLTQELTEIQKQGQIKCIFYEYFFIFCIVYDNRCQF